MYLCFANWICLLLRYELSCNNSREKFIFEPMSVIDIETTVTKFLRSESKRFDTRYAGELTIR